MVQTLSIELKTRGNGDILDITGQSAAAVRESGLKDGTLTIFCPSSTSALTTIEYESGCISDLRRLFDEITMHSEGALIDAEILAKAARRGYRIGQVGVHHYPRLAGTQTGAQFKVIARAFIELFKLRRQIIREQ